MLWGSKIQVLNRLNIIVCSLLYNTIGTLTAQYNDLHILFSGRYAIRQLGSHQGRGTLARAGRSAPSLLPMCDIVSVYVRSQRTGQRRQRGQSPFCSPSLLQPVEEQVRSLGGASGSAERGIWRGPFGCCVVQAPPVAVPVI